MQRCCWSWLMPISMVGCGRTKMEKECGLKVERVLRKCEKERKIIGLSLCPDDGRTKPEIISILKPRRQTYLKTKTKEVS